MIKISIILTHFFLNIIMIKFWFMSKNTKKLSYIVVPTKKQKMSKIRYRHLFFIRILEVLFKLIKITKISKLLST